MKRARCFRLVNGKRAWFNPSQVAVVKEEDVGGGSTIVTSSGGIYNLTAPARVVAAVLRCEMPWDDDGCCPAHGDRYFAEDKEE